MGADVNQTQPKEAGKTSIQLRQMMLVSEVAKQIRVTDQHVLNLIETGELVAIDVGTGTRSHWRIPVESYESYKAKRNSLKPGVVK